MKPLTKEQFEIIKDWVWAARLNCTHDAMHSIEQHAYALLVNDSDPVVMAPYCKADLPAYDGKPVYTYNPETHMLVPRVWSEEQEESIGDIFINFEGISAERILSAITKVFGGEK